MRDLIYHSSFTFLISHNFVNFIMIYCIYSAINCINSDGSILEVNNFSDVKVLSISLFLAGLFFANIGLSTSIIFITMAGFMFFAVLPFVNTSIEVLIRRNIDNRKQGRVWSIISTITYLGSIVAFIVAGFLADKVFNPLLEVNGQSGVST